jgi:hypothetical protein
MNGENSSSAENRPNMEQQDGGTVSQSGQVNLDDIMEQIPRVEFRPMSGPTLPPKP